MSSVHLYALTIMTSGSYSLLIYFFPLFPTYMTEKMCFLLLLHHLQHTISTFHIKFILAKVLLGYKIYRCYCGNKRDQPSFKLITKML